MSSPAPRSPAKIARKSADRRQIKALAPYMWLWFAALTGVIFALIALSFG